MKHILLMGLCLMSFMESAFGQIPYTLSGKVSDQKGQALPGATLVLHPGSYGGISDQDGSYTMVGLPPGEYVLSCSFLGYEKLVDTLQVRNNVRWDIQLAPSRQSLQEVVVTGEYAEIRAREEALNLEVVHEAFLKQHLGGSLMKSLDRLPGVDAFGIGAGQSKPVIRGLGFNRVVVVENGIKHEGQQWGSDHGLEVDQFASKRVEVIKGPSSLAFGSDALGGAVIIEHEALPEMNAWGGAVDLSSQSNNGLFGGSLQVQGRREHFFGRIRATYLDYGDYRVPADSVDIHSYRAALHEKRLRNTAGKEGALHLETGWIGRGYSNRLFFSILGNKNGFFANAHGLEPRQVDADLHDRRSRDILYPYHQVHHWKVINKSVWRWERLSLKADLGVQRNFRQEWSAYVNHGYMPPAFPYSLSFPSDLERQFDKYTYSGNVHLNHETPWRMKLSAGLQGEFQDNRIDGRGFIIPAYEHLRVGAFMLLKQPTGDHGLLSAGLRFDGGTMQTQAYQDWYPSPEEEERDTLQVHLSRSEALQRVFSSISWSLGYNLNREHLSLKVNLGKSFRMPLAKELAANGVNYHRFSYEVGTPDLDPETAFQLDAGLEWNQSLFALGISPFASYFPNYIYLNPTSEHDRLYGNGNQVYRYTQSKVIRMGGELHAHYQPLPYLRMGLIGEYIYSEQISGQKQGFTLPFSPPASLLLNMRFMQEAFWRLSNSYASLDLRMVAAQERIVPPEEATAAYSLVNLGLGGDVTLGKQVISLRIQVQNLLNRKYLDHTSYYRLINVPERGRNVIVSITVPFSGPMNN